MLGLTICCIHRPSALAGLGDACRSGAWISPAIQCKCPISVDAREAILDICIFTASSPSFDCIDLATGLDKQAIVSPVQMQVSPLHGESFHVPATSRHSIHPQPARNRPTRPCRESQVARINSPSQPRCRRFGCQFGEGVGRTHVSVGLTRCRSEPDLRERCRKRMTDMGRYDRRLKSITGAAARVLQFG